LDLFATPGGAAAEVCWPGLHQLYDGLGSWDPSENNSWSGEFDDYDQWFESQLPGKDPQATLDSVDGDGWNSWIGRPYICARAVRCGGEGAACGRLLLTLLCPGRADDEYYHPTAWLGRKAVSWLQQYDGGKPFYFKVSFHRLVLAPRLVGRYRLAVDC
jgi:hypothetical protein